MLGCIRRFTLLPPCRDMRCSLGGVFLKVVWSTVDPHASHARKSPKELLAQHSLEGRSPPNCNEGIVGPGIVRNPR